MLFKQGRSRTLNSKHLIGRAVDVVPIVNGGESWQWPDYAPLVETARAVAAELGVPLEFGYDWGWDAPHWEMKEL